jgi:adenylate cyclase
VLPASPTPEASRWSRRRPEDGEDLTAAARRLREMGLTALVPEDLREPEAVAGVRIVAFCDLVASTQLNVAVGDRRYAELIAELTDSLRAGLPANGGVEFKHTGDGLAVWFTSVVAAIRWTQQVSSRLRALTEAHPSESLLLRFGIAAGEPVDRSGDLFGLAVALAARLCAEAGPGEVLVAEEVRLLAVSQGISFRAAGRFRLKGFTEDVAAHVVVTDDDGSRSPSRGA